MHENHYVAVAAAEAIAENTLHATRVGDTAVLICNVAGEYFAVENQCSHAAASLSAGYLRAHRITCPLHGASFDVRTGEATARPATRPVRTFPTRVRGGMVEVAV